MEGGGQQLTATITANLGNCDHGCIHHGKHGYSAVRQRAFLLTWVSTPYYSVLSTPYSVLSAVKYSAAVTFRFNHGIPPRRASIRRAVTLPVEPVYHIYHLGFHQANFSLMLPTVFMSCIFVTCAASPCIQWVARPVTRGIHISGSAGTEGVHC